MLAQLLMTLAIQCAPDISAQLAVTQSKVELLDRVAKALFALHRHGRCGAASSGLPNSCLLSVIAVLWRDLRDLVDV